MTSGPPLPFGVGSVPQHRPAHRGPVAHPHPPARSGSSPASHAPPSVRGVVTLDGASLVIKFSGKHHGFINAVKTIKGYRWDPTRNSWIVHVGNIRHVRYLADLHGWTLSPKVAAIPDLDLSAVPIVVSVEGEQLIIDSPFREDVWKALADCGGHHHERTGRWFVPAEMAFDAVMDLERIGNVQFIGDSSTIMEQIEAAREMLLLSRALEPSPGFVLAPSIIRTLHGFQAAGVEYLARARRGFAWGTVGAGKTTVGLAALEQLGAYPALVIPPAGLKTNWAREVQDIIPHRRVAICEGLRAANLFDDRLLVDSRPDIVICNAEILGDPTKPRSWALSFITGGHLRGIVVDEGHRMNNAKTQRTAAAIAITESLPPDAARFLLTATPVVNKRIELHPQLAVIGRDGEFGDKKRIKDDTRLSRRLRTVCAWRPDPKEVLVKLGVINADGSVDPIEQTILVDGEPAAMAEYRRCEDDFLTFIADKARAKAIELGQDPESAAVEAELKASSSESLTLITHLCRLAGYAKLKAAKEWTADFLASGEKLLVFAEHHDVMDALSGGQIPQIHGGVKHADRQVLVDRFQERAGFDPIQAMVLQTKAAGEGLTLTKAWHVMFAELQWTYAAHFQAIGRGHMRMSDPHPVVAHYLVAKDTIDEARMKIIANKREEAKSVVDGDRETITAESTFGDVFSELLHKALKRKKPK